MALKQKMEELDQLRLQNLMLKLSLEQERIDKHKAMISEAQANSELLKFQIGMWKHEYNVKLNEKGLDINNVQIDAETGMITPIEEQT